MRDDEYNIVDAVYLKQPERGYYYVEIIDKHGEQLTVRTTSGYEFTIYPDEIDRHA